MNRSRCDRQSGNALAFSVVVIFVIGVVSAIFLSSAMDDYRMTRFTIAEERAFLAAEAGVDVAMVELKKLEDLATDGLGNAVGDLAGGGYDVTIDPPYAGPGEYTLRATGSYDREERSLEVVIVTGASTGRWQDALLSQSWVDIRSGSRVDSYDSRTGTYSDQYGSGYASTSGNVRSNGPVDLTNGSQVWGDACSGPQSGVTLDGSSSVSGATAPAMENADIESYDYSPPIAASGSGYFLDGSMGGLSTGTYRYPDLSITSTGTLTISGSVVLYVDGRFDLEGVIVLEEGASLLIHHGSGDFLLRNGARLGSAAHGAEAVQVFSATTERVSIESGSEMVGVIDAPGASGSVCANSTLYGAMVANTILLESDSWVHYDEALVAGGGGDDSQGIEIIMIREI